MIIEQAGKKRKSWARTNLNAFYADGTVSGFIEIKLRVAPSLDRIQKVLIT